MATATVALPPLGEISLVTTWMGTMLYGVNCVLYGLTMYLLVPKQEHTSKLVLMLTSTVLFVLCTAYVAASLRQLLEAFIYIPADSQDYATLYFYNSMLPMRSLKDILYITLTFVQDIVLIWRLYVVFDRDWRVPGFFLLMDLASIGVGYYANAISLAMPNTTPDTLVPLTIAGWTLDLTVNIFVTLTIATRIWWMGRHVASFRTTHVSGNPYSYSAYVVIESGAIFSSAMVIMLALYGYENESPFPYMLPSLDVGAQLAVLTPLLIVVRVRMYQNNVGGSKTSETGQSVTSIGHGLRAKLVPRPEVYLDDRTYRLNSLSDAIKV